MKLHLHSDSKSNLIQRYNKSQKNFSIQIDNKIYEKSVLLSSEGTTELNIQHPNQLTEQHFHLFAEKNVEVFILGTGENIVFPKSNLTKPLICKYIGLEVMTNEAACSTYSILMSDGRNIAAAILM